MLIHYYDSTCRHSNQQEERRADEGVHRPGTLLACNMAINLSEQSCEASIPLLERGDVSCRPAISLILAAC